MIEEKEKGDKNRKRKRVGKVKKEENDKRKRRNCDKKSDLILYD